MSVLFYCCIFLSASETLFVFGGGNDDLEEPELDLVDGISLSGEIVSCPSIASLPYQVSEFHGVTLNGQPVACGGYEGYGKNNK